jgi:pyruvate,orthophosphate dikinase
MAKKYVYFFGNGKAEGNGTQKDLLGGKGAGLAGMSSGGACSSRLHHHHGHLPILLRQRQKVAPELAGQSKEAMAKLEKALGKKFGSSTDPLWFRSDPARSFPCPA